MKIIITTTIYNLQFTSNRLKDRPMFYNLFGLKGFSKPKKEKRKKKTHYGGRKRKNGKERKRKKEKGI